MKIFLLVIFSFCLYPTYAQTDYVVTSRGDTLNGKTKILTYDILDRVQVVVNKKKMNYTALEATTVVLEGVTYHTIKYDRGYRYMKLIKQGFLSLYGFRLPNQATYDGQYLVKRDGSTMEIPNLTFKRSITNFLGDCNEIKERIKSGDLGRKDMDQIIDRYNSCLQFKTEKIMASTPVVIAPIEDDKMIAINSLITKIEAGVDFTSKRDVLDLLKDLRSKVGRSEILPNYLTKEIKNYLNTQPQFTEDVDNLLVLLKK